MINIRNFFSLNSRKNTVFLQNLCGKIALKYGNITASRLPLQCPYFNGFIFIVQKYIFFVFRLNIGNSIRYWLNNKCNIGDNTSTCR